MSRKQRERWVEATKDQLLANEQVTDKTVKELFLLYDEAAYKTENELHALVSRYADDNGMTLTEARRMLNAKEHSQWRYGLQDYLKKVQGGKDSKILLELNTLAAKSRVSRMEQLLGNMYRNMAELAQSGGSLLDDVLGGLLQTNYLRSCYNIQHSMGLGFNISQINKNQLREILDYPWATKNFSENLWGKSDRIAQQLRRELTLGAIDGSSVQKTAKRINDTFNSGRYAAERLVRTESKFFANQGELQGYIANGIKKYKFVGGTEGSVNCECAHLNGQIFNVEEAEPWVNFPPIHPNCLCIVVAAFERSMFEKRTDVVPLAENTKFLEWKKRHVV